MVGGKIAIVSNLNTTLSELRFMPDTCSSQTQTDQKIGVLLVNLGTPDAPDQKSIKRYLNEFLSDPRVVEVPRLLWWCVLNFVILRFRPKKLVPDYQKIWQGEQSPLRKITNNQVNKLQMVLDGSLVQDKFVVKSAMTYGNPSFETAFLEMKSKGIEKILVLPLYPQYSATTTAASYDAMSRALANIRDIPETRFIKRYHNHPKYIQALAESIKAHWEKLGRQAKLLISFHGIPEEYVEKGDPYAQDCEQTTQLLVSTLGLKSDEWLQCYQSRVGTKEWLKPYTDDSMKTLGQEQQKGLDVICPGFSADCLETLEEIDGENREYFEEKGGSDYHYIPALNEQHLHIELLADLVKSNVAGWL